MIERVTSDTVQRIVVARPCSQPGCEVMVTCRCPRPWCAEHKPRNPRRSRGNAD